MCLGLYRMSAKKSILCWRSLVRMEQMKCSREGGKVSTYTELLERL